MNADQLLNNLANGQYDDCLSGRRNPMTETFSFMEFLKVFHPAEYEERVKKMATTLETVREQYATKDQLLTLAHELGFWDFDPKSIRGKNGMVFAFPAAMWEINGFSCVRVTRSGGTIYPFHVEYLR